jgi:hypothetical protein
MVITLAQISPYALYAVSTRPGAQMQYSIQKTQRQGANTLLATSTKRSRQITGADLANLSTECCVLYGE